MPRSSPTSETDKTKLVKPGEPLLTGRGFVEYIQQKFLPGFKYSRFRKDRAAKKAPEPAAHFGPSELFYPSQAPGYVESLINRAEPETKQPRERHRSRRSSHTLAKSAHAS